MADDLVDELAQRLGNSPLRVLLAGPAGVGKSYLAQNLASRFSISHIEHDLLKSPKDLFCPCKSRNFDPYDCFSSSISLLEQFVIDIGGGTVFRQGADNNARLARISAFKQDFRLSFVLLVAERAIVRERCLQSKAGTLSGFKGDWADWENIEYIWWQRCADFELKPQ